MLGENNRTFKYFTWSPELAITKISTESPENQECDKFSPLACRETRKDSPVRNLNFQEGCPSCVHCEDHTDIPPSKTQTITLRIRIKEIKTPHSVKSKLKIDLVGSRYRQGTAVTVLGLCWSWGTHPVVASLHSRMRGSHSLAVFLQVALMLHLPPHGGVPVVLDGVVRSVGGED